MEKLIDWQKRVMFSAILSCHRVMASSLTLLSKRLWLTVFCYFFLTFNSINFNLYFQMVVNLKYSLPCQSYRRLQWHKQPWRKRGHVIEKTKNGEQDGDYRCRVAEEKPSSEKRRWTHKAHCLNLLLNCLGSQIIGTDVTQALIAKPMLI